MKSEQEKQLVQVPMGGSLDESSPATLIGPGKLAAITDAKITGTGSVEVRPGFEKVSQSVVGALTVSLKDVYSHGNQIIGHNGEYLYSWSEEIDSWLETDFVPGCQVVGRDVGERAVYATGTGGLYPPQSSCADAVQIGNIRVTAWLKEEGATSSRSAWIRIQDVTSDARAAASKMEPLPTNQYTATGIRLIVGQDRYIYIIVSYTDAYGGSAATVAWIEGRRYDVTNIVGGMGSAVELVPNLARVYTDDPNVWEATCVGTYVLVAFKDNSYSGAPKGWVFRFNDDLTDKQIRDFTPYPQRRISCAGSSSQNTLYVAYDSTDCIYCVWINISAMAIAYAPVVIDNTTTPRALERIGIAVHSGGTFARVVYSLPAAVADMSHGRQDPQIRSTDVTSAGAVGDRHVSYNLSLIGQPFFRAGAPANKTMAECNVPVMVASKLWQQYDYVIDETQTVVPVTIPQDQNSSFIIKIRPYVAPDGNFYPGMVVTKLLPLITADMTKYYRPCGAQVLNATDEEYLMAVPVQADGSIDIDVGFDVFQFAFNTYGAIRPCRFGNVTLFSGGVPSQWDGDRFTELGFNWYPRISNNMTAPPWGIYQETNPGGQLTVTGNYEYKAIYTWQDKQGVRHYSDASLPRAVVMSGTNNRCIVEIDCLNLTNRQRNPLYGTYEDAPILIELYRTIDDGIEYYFVGRAINQLYSASVTITDDLSDTTIQSRRTIPTAGGKYATGCPGPMLQIASHDGRPWGILANDTTQIAFGHYAVPGDAPRFPDGWTLRCADGPGYTAIGSLGDKLIAFQAHAIDAIMGAGPNEQGTGQNYSDPHRICQVVGCTDHRSLIRYPSGYLFMAQSGLWTINEAFTAQYQGAAIQNQLAAFPEVRQALLDDSEYRILLICKNPDTGYGTVLVWHYPWDHWCSWRIQNHDGSAVDSFAGGCIGTVDYSTGAQGVYLVNDHTTGLSGKGQVIRQRSNAIDPPTSWVSLELTTGWISVAGLQGFGHTWQIGLLGTWTEQHSLDFTVYYNYDSNQSSSHSFSAAEVTAAVSGRRLQLVAQCTYPEAQAIQIKVRMSPVAGCTTGRCSRLEAITVEAATEAGMVTLQSACKK
jgi:hypothetical protein